MSTARGALFWQGLAMPIVRAATQAHKERAESTRCLRDITDSWFPVDLEVIERMPFPLADLLFFPHEPRWR